MQKNRNKNQKTDLKSSPKRSLDRNRGAGMQLCPGEALRLQRREITVADYQLLEIRLIMVSGIAAHEGRHA
jgi:hypothetical protein